MICARRDGPLFGETGTSQLHLTATLSAPRGAVGLALVVQSCGESEPSEFQQLAARTLRSAGFASCLIDLLDPSEGDQRAKRSDVDLLTERLERVVEHLGSNRQTWHLPVGILATGAAAAAAITLAAERPELARTVVSCVGRPDLAMSAPADLVVPTMLIVASNDATLLEQNEQLFLALRCDSQLAVVCSPGPCGAAEGFAAAERAVKQWFRKHMRRRFSPATAASGRGDRPE